MELLELNWPQVRDLPRATPFVFPIAALEQHGHHMPLFTDSLLLEEVVKRVKPHFQDRVVFAPLQWLGNSEHHLDFPGTLSAGPRTYLDLLKELARNLLFHGFERILFLNGHGGNIVPAQQALFELRQETRSQFAPLLLSATYWTLSEGAPDSRLTQKEMGHACEWETSMMLCIRPDLVKNHQAVEPVPFGRAFAPAHRAWVTKDRTVPGHIGQPHLATTEKGEFLFQGFAKDVSRLLERMIAWDGKEWDA